MLFCGLKATLLWHSGRFYLDLSNDNGHATQIYLIFVEFSLVIIFVFCWEMQKKNCSRCDKLQNEIEKFRRFPVWDELTLDHGNTNASDAFSCGKRILRFEWDLAELNISTEMSSTCCTFVCKMFEMLNLQKRNSSLTHTKSHHRKWLFLSWNWSFVWV